MRFIVYFLLISSSIFSNETKHFLTICAFFKNESRYLKEWIEYHRIQGVEKFYLYNNSSTDDFYKILYPYIQKNIVQVIYWPNKPGAKNHVMSQTSAYRDCIEKNLNQSSWIAFIDIDEFIVPVTAPSLRSFIQSLDDLSSIGSIEINWQLYGTSGIKKLGSLELVSEKFVMKAHDNFEGQMQLSHKQFKSIVRPEAVKKMTIHYADLFPSYTVYPVFQENRTRYLKPINISELRINHYWTRDEDFFLNTKIQRRKDVFKTDGEIFKRIAKDLNTVEDTCIYRFLPELKERVFSNTIYD